MAHFVKPLGVSSAGFKQRSDGALTGMTLSPVGATKIVILWGGGRGGEILMLAAIDHSGKRLATTRFLGKEGGHAPDPDGDDRWFLRYELKTVAEGTGTLTALDKTGMPFARIELAAASSAGSVTELEDVLHGAVARNRERMAVSPGSELPFKRPPAPNGQKLAVVPTTARVHELRFRMEKDGITFWVGACVPEGTIDFTRAYVFFHPDVMAIKDDATYPEFGGAWPGVARYTVNEGVQVATKKMILLVPLMTNASRSNQPSTNMFASRGLETLNALMNGCATAIGQTPKGTKLVSIGVASFSSGINHLARFAGKIGGSGIIKEQIDLDGAFITRAPHSEMPRLKGAKNIQVTQMSPGDPRVRLARVAADEWLQLNADAWPKTNFGEPKTNNVPNSNTIHANIGNLMLRAMIEKSAVT